MADPGISVVLDAGLIALVVSNLGIIGREVFRSIQSKRSNGNGNGKKCDPPGQAEMCIQHHTDIAVLKSEISNIEKTVQNTDTTVREIYNHIKNNKNGSPK